MKAFCQPQISNSKCLYILCVWVEQSARCFAMQVRIKLQVSILPTSREPGLWFYGSKMPEQADPPLFGKLVDFVCPSCVRHYVQLCFPFFSYFAEWKSFVISPGYHRDVTIWYHRDVTIWYHRDVTFWYHRDVTIWYQNVTSLWYLGDVTNWCHSDITNFSHSDISCDISVTSLWHQIVDWGINDWLCGCMVVWVREFSITFAQVKVIFCKLHKSLFSLHQILCNNRQMSGCLISKKFIFQNMIESGEMTYMCFISLRSKKSV